MNESTFKLNFDQRRLLSSASKMYYYVAGLIEIAIGVFVLIKSIKRWDIFLIFFD